MGAGEERDRLGSRGITLTLVVVRGERGYHALEGTSLGGCLFSGRAAGRAAAQALA